MCHIHSAWNLSPPTPAVVPQHSAPLSTVPHEPLTAQGVNTGCLGVCGLLQESVTPLCPLLPSSSTAAFGLPLIFRISVLSLLLLLLPLLLLLLLLLPLLGRVNYTWPAIREVCRQPKDPHFCLAGSFVSTPKNMSSSDYCQCTEQKVQKIVLG
ncbi:hypothetical protein E2C01_004938 [Portunus trituberculatus]|uniref:Uncharacterized protein n=1 Tax=Portunus trituberculatus TaxID=210409 RepID=A0A5B7CV90_PORTR|nr:hypothetical protein [Portunus trituberculatus]